MDPKPPPQISRLPLRQRLKALQRTRFLRFQKDHQEGLLKNLGPGLITGASDDDPSGIGTYSQAGAQFGFSIGWTMLLTFPLMAAIQEISARIGRGTGHGLAGHVCRYLPAPLWWAFF